MFFSLLKSSQIQNLEDLDSTSGFLRHRAAAAESQPVQGEPRQCPTSNNHDSIDNDDTFYQQTAGISQSTPGVILNLPKLTEIQNPKPSFHVRSYVGFPFAG